MRQRHWGVMRHPVPPAVPPLPALGRVLHPGQAWERRGTGTLSPKLLHLPWDCRAHSLRVQERDRFHPTHGVRFRPRTSPRRGRDGPRSLVPGPRTSIAAPSPAPVEAGMLIPVRGRSGADLGPASLSLLPTDPNSDHLLWDGASPPGPWFDVAAGRITLAVKSHLQAPINSR